MAGEHMAPRLEWSDALGRMTRTEQVSEQGILTWDLVRDAILEGRRDDAIAWLRYIQNGENYVKPTGPGVVARVQSQLAYIARRYGEEHVERLLRWWRRKLVDAGGEPTYRMTPLERLQYHAEMERADYSGVNGRFEVREEADRYVMMLGPCGNCGKLRRAETAGTSDLGKTSRPYAWSWGQAGVPYYCTHQCVWWEIMAIEDLGYPVKITEWSPAADVPCRILFYKDPAAIPEKYFARVGLTKDRSRFR